MKPKQDKPADPPADPKPAQDAIDRASDAIDDLDGADDDDKEFAELLATARTRLKEAEKEIRWLKDKVTETESGSTRINSTLEKLSSTVADLQNEMKEAIQKFQQLTQPTTLTPPEEPKAPVTETPAIQSVKPTEPAKPDPTKVLPEDSDPVVEPIKKRRFI